MGRFPQCHVESKWRVYNALLGDQPLTPAQIKERIVRQCGLFIDPTDALTDLYLEGFAKQDSFRNEWWREAIPKDAEIGEELLWEQENADGGEIAIVARFYVSGEVRVEVMSFPDDTPGRSFGFGPGWKIVATNEVPQGYLPADAEAILTEALDHYRLSK